MKRWLTASGVAAIMIASGACGIPLADEGAEAQNSCSSDLPCGNGAQCLDGICVSTKASLGDVYLQIDVPSDASYGASTSSLIRLSDEGVAIQGDGVNGYWKPLDLESERVAQVSASLQIPDLGANLAGVCEGQLSADGYVPIRVELRQLPQIPGAGESPCKPSQDDPPPVGLPLKTFSKSTDDGTTLEDLTEPLNVTVQTGCYDISIRPDLPEEDENGNLAACRLPPLLFLNQHVKEDTSAEQSTSQPPQAVTGTFLGGFDTTGWTVDLVENAGGRRISTRSRVTVDVADGSKGFMVHAWPSVLNASGITPVVRLTPPEGTPSMPVVLWQLASVDFDADYDVELDVAALGQHVPAEVGGKMVRDDDPGEAVPGTLVIQSESLFESAFGDNVSFRTTITTDGEGTWSTQLLPGEYNVIAIPSSDPELAVTSNSLTVTTDSAQLAKSVTVERRTSLVGRALTPNGLAAGQMPVTLQPSFGEGFSYLKSVLDMVELPGTASTLTASDGSFSMLADPGKLDLSIQPEPSSGLPWLVLPRLDAQFPELGELRIPYPAVLQGQVRAPSQHVLGGAQIRAFVTVSNTSDEDKERGIQRRPTAVQVAEATADAQGMYRLLLPASISSQ